MIDLDKIAVCVPSYKRPKVETLAYLPFARVYVAFEEYEAYRKANRKAEIIQCPKGVQGNLCRVRNHIIDEEFKRGMEVVCIVDDDMKKMAYYECGIEHDLETGDFLEFLSFYSDLARQFGAYFWGVNVNFDKKTYRETTPFSTLSYCGGPFQVFLRGGECRYDERLPLKEDYDMTLQQLRRYRVVLRLNKFHYYVKQSKQAGGCATYRNIEAERQQFEALVRKWGPMIVRSDSHNYAKRDKKNFDYNPVIKCPIPGV